MRDVIAVGDNFNDLEMIEIAGLGIAMGNAPDAVKKRSDWIAPSVDDDGLAVAIERFALQNSAGDFRSVNGATSACREPIDV